MSQCPGLSRECLCSFCLDHMSNPGPIPVSGEWGALIGPLDLHVGTWVGSLYYKAHKAMAKKDIFVCLLLFLPEKRDSSLDRQSSRCLLRGAVGEESYRQQELHVPGPVPADRSSKKLKTNVGGQ